MASPFMKVPAQIQELHSLISSTLWSPSLALPVWSGIRTIYPLVWLCPFLGLPLSVSFVPVGPVDSEGIVCIGP